MAEMSPLLTNVTPSIGISAPSGGSGSYGDLSDVLNSSSSISFQSHLSGSHSGAASVYGLDSGASVRPGLAGASSELHVGHAHGHGGHHPRPNDDEDTTASASMSAFQMMAQLQRLHTPDATSGATSLSAKYESLIG